MASVFTTKALKQSPKGETILLQSDPSNSRSFVPRRIKWEEVTLPESWTSPNAIPPKPIENSNVEYVVKDSKGNVEISFTRDKKIQPLRSSCSSIQQKTFNPSKTFSQKSRLTRSKSFVNLRSINHASRVPDLFYENEFKKNSQTSSPPLSPSYSQMEGPSSEIYVIIKEEEFQINKEKLRKAFYSNHNTEKRNWFFKNFG